MGTAKFQTVKTPKGSLLLRIEGAGDGSRANFDFGVPLDQISYENHITKLFHVGGHPFGVLPFYKNGFFT